MERIRRAARRSAPAGRGSAGVALATLLLGSLPSTAPAQFSVRPAVLEIDASGERTVVVRNESDVPRVFHVYAGDFDQSPIGVHRFLSPGDHEGGCHGRLEVFPDRLAVDPGRDAGIRVRLAPGEGSCWSVVFVEHRPLAFESGGRAIERVAVQVLATDPDDLRDAAVRDVTVERADDGPVVRYVLENLGDTPLRPRGRLEFRSLEGDVVSTVRLDPFGLLPRHARIRDVPLPPDLPSGSLLAVPILDFGADHLVAGRALFENGE